jgi:hypothetical protein
MHLSSAYPSSAQWIEPEPQPMALSVSARVQLSDPKSLPEPRGAQFSSPSAVSRGQATEKQESRIRRG